MPSEHRKAWRRAYEKKRSQTLEYKERRKAFEKKRSQTPEYKERKRGYEKARAPRKRVATKRPRRIVGIDGEGMDTPDGRHLYTYLAAVDEHGALVAEASNPEGLTHEECAAMLVSIPRNTLKFGFMFSYDVTKIIEELPALDRYCLMRPNTRVAIFCKK